MSTGRRLFATAAALAISVLLAWNSDMTAQASGCSLDSFNSGISAVLNAKGTSVQSAEKMADLVSIDDEDETEAESGLVMANVTNAVNVRSSASEDSEKVGKLYRDCGGTVLERGNGWTKIRSGNVIGWVKDDYLLFDDEARELAEDVGVMVASMNGVTRVRTEPGTEAAEMGLLPKGEQAEVLDLGDDGWVCIDFEGEDGYVLQQYVTLDYIIDTAESSQEIAAREAKEAEAAAAAAAAEAEAKRHVNYGEATVDTDSAMLLAALIQCEAGSESYEGQLAVGSVIMNRVRSSAYPDTVHGVIYASGQFGPASSGRVNSLVSSGNISSSCLKAANEAIAGVSNIGSCTHFRRNDGRDGYVIGNHVFY